MKRRLTSAYDRMIMPDRCSRKIEALLLEGREQQKTGRYARVISPVPARRQGWAVGAALVCLLVVLSVGGTMLFLTGTEEVPVQAAVATAALGDYSLVTELPAEEVEAFAAEIRQNVVDGNWENFAQKVNYPLPVYEREIRNAEKLMDLTTQFRVQESFVERIGQETCVRMYSSGQGIRMADGRIWINEVDGKLKITAINDMFEPLISYTDFRYATADDGNLAILSYNGLAEGIAFPSGYGEKTITQIGTGEPVIRNGDLMTYIKVPESVSVVRERAFADCPNLTEVYFKGDAPAEAKGVFDGSENVVVHYDTGTKGWGETWCGRMTQARDPAYVSLGTVQVKEQKQATRQAFQAVLEGNGTFWSVEYNEEFTIQEYCAKRSKVESAAVTVPYFTLVDMDRDEIKELALWVSIEGDPLEDYLILRHTSGNDDQGFVYTYMEPGQMITDLKKDGSFYQRGDSSGRGDTRVVLDKNDTKLYVSDISRTERTPVLWHAWPCVRPEAVLQSYEYVGTGQNRFPGNQWYAFEGIVNGTMNNNWAEVEAELTRWGMVCLEEEGEVSVYDPDAPGCRLFGTLDAYGRFVHIGYYISNEHGEREAKVRYVFSEEPQYICGSHLEELDARSREVNRLKALLEYLS